MNFLYNIFVVIGLVFSNSLSAQLYDTALGVRLGAPLSLSYKKIINEDKVIEGYLGTRKVGDFRFVNLSAAYQFVQPVDLWSIEELYYYYGGGASIYLWSIDGEGNNQRVSPGLQGYLGLEYTFADRPLNLTVDWIPSLFFSGNISGLRGGYLAIGVRYVLSRDGSGSLNVSKK
ncbi:MAG: hypothetical protein AAF960_26870 [Bacteroidota bacterium]